MFRVIIPIIIAATTVSSMRRRLPDDAICASCNGTGKQGWWHPTKCKVCDGASTGTGTVSTPDHIQSEVGGSTPRFIPSDLLPVLKGNISLKQDVHDNMNLNACLVAHRRNREAVFKQKVAHGTRGWTVFKKKRKHHNRFNDGDDNTYHRMLWHADHSHHFKLNNNVVVRRTQDHSTFSMNGCTIQVGQLVKLKILVTGWLTWERKMSVTSASVEELGEIIHTKKTNGWGLLTAAVTTHTFTFREFKVIFIDDTGAATIFRNGNNVGQIHCTINDSLSRKWSRFKDDAGWEQMGHEFAKKNYDGELSRQQPFEAYLDHAKEMRLVREFVESLALWDFSFHVKGLSPEDNLMLLATTMFIRETVKKFHQEVYVQNFLHMN